MFAAARADAMTGTQSQSPWIGAGRQADRWFATLDDAPGRAFLIVWLVVLVAFYLPFAFPSLRVLEPDDLLGSEFVWNVAAGRWWFGDPSIVDAFLVGQVPLLVLPRLTQPLIILYGLLPPLSAYLATDVIVRGVAAAGAFHLLRALHVPRTFQHLLAAVFAVGIVNSTFALSIAGLPAAAFLMGWRSGRLRLALIFLIAWNSSLYLSGIFYLAAAPFFQRYLFDRCLDRRFWSGWLTYALGLGLGSAGLLWLALTSHVHWHREEWALFPATELLPLRPWQIHVGQPLLALFLIAAATGISDRRVRFSVAFAVFILAWYQLFHLHFVQQWIRSLGSPLAYIQLDRFYFLWTFNLLVLLGLASIAAKGLRRGILFAAALAGLLVAASPQQHFRQLVRNAIGRKTGYPPYGQYYHLAWFKRSGLNSSTPVMSLGMDPMIAPLNGIPSIDGHFPLYPLEYKHRFRRVVRNSLGPSGTTDLFDSWGNKVYAFYPPNRPDLLDFCAARSVGARFVLSPEPVTSSQLQLVKPGELNIYRIVC